MNTDIKKQILSKIESYDKIILTRHIRPDGDAVGSTLGFQKLIQLNYPQKKVLVINDDYADYVRFMGDEDAQINDDDYAGCLGIVLDSGTFDRISNKKMHLAKELIKIDHHIVEEPYGDIAWVEEERSSTCEMIIDFYDTFSDRLRLNTEIATLLYTGLVTDSGRFRYTNTSSETLRLAAILKQFPIDTEELYAHLYLNDIQSIYDRSFFCKHIRMTPNGVAYIHVTSSIQEKRGLTQEQSSRVVDYMDSIIGSMIWLAFIDTPDGSIRVRLRSRYINIQPLATRYHGGGHDKACGATIYSKQEMRKLIKEANVLLKEFKEANPQRL